MRPSLVEYSKRELTAEQRRKNERLQAQVGLASNVVGLAAGGAATGTAIRDYSNARRERAGLPPKPPKDTKISRASRRLKTKHAVGLAGAGLALQGMNVGGDVVANRVLARSAKEPKKETSKRLDPHTKRGLYLVGASGAAGAITGKKHPFDFEFKNDRDDSRGKRRRVRKEATMTGDSTTDVYESEGRGDGRGHSLQSVEKAMRATPEHYLGTRLFDEEIVKRARRYDPEADRQRRSGLYAGLGIGGSALAGREAADRLSGHVDAKARTVTVPRIKLKGLKGAELKQAKRGRAGVGLAALSALSGAGGVAAYRRGISRRNQPYN